MHHLPHAPCPLYRVLKPVNFTIAAPPGGTNGTVCHTETLNLICNSSEVVVARIQGGGLPNRDGPTENCTYDPSKHCLGYQSTGGVSISDVRNCVWKKSSCSFGPRPAAYFSCKGVPSFLNIIIYSQFQCYNSKYVL